MSKNPLNYHSKTLEGLMDRVYSLEKNDDESIDERWNQEQLYFLEQDIIAFFTDHPEQINDGVAKYGDATILHAVCKLDLVESLKWLLKVADANPNVIDDKGFMPFFTAAKHNAPECVEYLCGLQRERGDIKYYDSNNSENIDALTCAALAGNVNIAESIVEFLESGAGLNASKELALAMLASVGKDSDDLQIVRVLKELPARGVGDESLKIRLPIHALASAAQGYSGERSGGPTSAAVYDAPARAPAPVADLGQGDTMDDEEIDLAMKNCLPSGTKYFERVAVDSSQLDPKLLFLNVFDDDSQNSATFLADASKNSVVMVFGVSGHYVSFFARKNSSAPPAVTEFFCFDPAKETPNHLVSDGLIAALKESFGEVSIRRSSSEIQPLDIAASEALREPILSNNHCGRFACFVMAGMAFGKITFGEDGVLNLTARDGSIHSVNALDPYESRCLGEIIAPYVITPHENDDAKREAFEAVAERFVNEVILERVRREEEGRRVHGSRAEEAAAFSRVGRTINFDRAALSSAALTAHPPALPADSAKLDHSSLHSSFQHEVDLLDQFVVIDDVTWDDLRPDAFPPPLPPTPPAKWDDEGFDVSARLTEAGSAKRVAEAAPNPSGVSTAQGAPVSPRKRARGGRGGEDSGESDSN